MLKKAIITVIILLIFILALSLIGQITDSLKSKERLFSQANIVSKLEAENRDLKEKLSNTESPEFIEEQARNKLGLSKSGDTIVIIPDERLKLVIGASESSSEIRLPNWQGWLRVFWH